MFHSVFYGVATALGWGIADFIARFTGRAMGHQTALFGMFSISAVIFTFIFIFSDIHFVNDYQHIWLIILSGLGIMVSTLLLYWGIVRGPITVVCPIVGAYPAFNLLIAVILGVHLLAMQWLAILFVLLGVVIVAIFAESRDTDQQDHHPDIQKTIMIAFAASLGFALAIIAAQAAIKVYGELQTAMLGRWVGVLGLVLLFLVKRERPMIQSSWLPLLGLQGIMDGGAYLCLLQGSQGIGAQIAVVIGSVFSVVTVLLARFILKEQMNVYQWSGVGLIITGVVLLSWY